MSASQGKNYEEGKDQIDFLKPTTYGIIEDTAGQNISTRYWELIPKKFNNIVEQTFISLGLSRLIFTSYNINFSKMCIHTPKSL